MNTNLQNSKSLLAKLLAAENITVSHQNTKTAYFDLKSRTLVCPVWKDMDGHLYDLLMGHEVGHALNTPQAGWHSAIHDENGKPLGKFKDFLNVIEDARIERQVKRKFPGLSKSFAEAYKGLYERDFFGVKNIDVNKLNLIDRINLRYKMGAHLPVAFNDDDVEAYVQRVANKFKREQIVDNKTGNVDMRFNQMAVDQDYFIPVRDPAAPDPITTLPGATNLSEIADIEYIQKKLLTALRVPKAFLGFEEVVGDGKNLALQDIRFARTINRIQKSMLAELNKVAIVHLFLLGFEDELSNFTIGLTNPSTQADLLKIDVWKVF